MKIMISCIAIITALFCFTDSHPQERYPRFEQLKVFNIPEANQGIAVNDEYFYAIDNRAIGKYLKSTGKPVKKCADEENGPFIHLNSGVVVDGKLVAAHSNFPGIPMTSSVEIWDAETLEHIGTHSFGIQWGSCTWIDRHNGFWWAVFSHYNRFKDITGKNNTWSTLLKFDDNWNKLEGWIFPEEVLERFGEMSNSGGSWGPDGLLYCTGHDEGELYALHLPKSGSVLELISITPIDNRGQGIAWDRSNPGVIYTIKRKEKQVAVFQLLED